MLLKVKFHIGLFLLYGKKFTFLVLFLIAPVSIAYLIHHNGVTVPFMDQWDLVPLLEKAHAGELGLSDIWTQHNEHRIFFPRLLMLALASLTHWNIMYELYTNMILAGLILLFLYSLLNKTYGNYTPSWLIVVLSFLVFSPAQWENWSWGWQIQIFLSVLGTVAAVWSVSSWPSQLKGVIIGIVAAVIASYSFNNGLLTWIVVGMILLVKRERKWKDISLWIVAFIVTTVLYYYKYTKPAHHPSLLAFINHPYDFIRYVFAYLGSPLSFGKKDISITIGLLSVIIVCIGTISAKRSSEEDFNRLLPWLALGLYAILSAAATGIGRLGFGVSQAVVSRYTTISTLLTISALVIIVFWVKNYLRNNKQLPTKSIVLISSTSTLLILSYILTVSYGEKAFAGRKAYIESAAIYLENVDVATDKCLKVLYPDAAIVRERTKVLSKMGLLKGLGWQKIRPVKEGGLMAIDYVNDQLYGSLQDKVAIDLTQDKSLVLRGWAVDDKEKSSGDRVYLVFSSKDEEMIIPTRRCDRPDVAKYFGVEKYKHSGWSLIAKIKGFKPKCYNISLRILCNNRKEYYELDGDKPICFDRAQ